jgi:hypothetical protein
MGNISLTPSIATVLTKIKFPELHYASFSEFHPNRAGKMENP